MTATAAAAAAVSNIGRGLLLDDIGSLVIERVRLEVDRRRHTIMCGGNVAVGRAKNLGYWTDKGQILDNH